MIVVGISGKIGAGKTTLADYLCRCAEQFQPHLEPHVVGLADMMKEYAAAHLRCDRRLLFGTQEDKNTPLECNPAMTYRDALIAIGTAYKAIEPAHWVRRMYESLEARQAQTHKRVLALVHDVRFPDELDWIHAKGGLVIRLTATRGATAAQLAAVSECALDGYPFDCTIDNLDASAAFTGARAAVFLLSRGVFKLPIS